MLWLGYLEVDLAEKGASSSLWAARGWRGAGCPPNLTSSSVGSGGEGCPALRPLLPGEFTWQMSRCPTPPPPPHQSDICFAKPEGDSQCKERAKKKSPESTHGDTAGSVGVIHRPIGTVTTEQLQVVGPGFGPLHGLGGHRREEFGERWSCWRMETAAGAAAFPRARLLPPAGLQPGDSWLRMGMAIVAQGVGLAPDGSQIGALEHSWGHHIPQGADLRGHLLKTLPQTPGKAVAAKATCTTGPPDCCCSAMWCWTQAGANRSLQQPHAMLGPMEW